MEKELGCRKPDFLIIGAGKAGTNALRNYLDQHPDISMSSRQEPNFFCSLARTCGETKGIRSWREYLATFDGAGAGQVLGEASPMYLYMPGTAEAIHSSVPDVKLIAMLRQPAERLFSRYMHLERIGRSAGMSLEDLWKEDSIWWTRRDLVREGFYYEHLKRYYDLFDRRQIAVFIYEEYRERPAIIYREICEFLEVDTAFVPELGVRLNQSGRIRSKFVDGIIGEEGVVKRVLRESMPGALEWVRRRPQIVKAIGLTRARILEKPSLDVDVRRRITERIYKKDIVALAPLIGRDLSGWLD